MIAVVELEEGPRLNTNIIDSSNAELQVGMPVQVAFEALSDEILIPKFHPARQHHRRRRVRQAV